jgi:hypothetical protein
VACVLQARDRAIFADRIRSVGKQARDESGKYPVNEDDEEISRCENMGTVIVRNKCREMPSHSASLRAQRSNPCIRSAVKWIASLCSQ